AELLAARHRRKPALLLLLGATHVDRAHRQAALHPCGSTDAAVAAGELHGDQTRRRPTHRRATVALEPVTDQAQLPEPPDQLQRHLRALPESVDHRQYFVINEPSCAFEVGSLVLGEVPFE